MADQPQPVTTPESAVSQGLRVLVCGGTEFSDWKVLQRTLAAVHAERGFSLVISGGAPGADSLAVRWAQHERIPVAVFPANWRFQGRAAGPIRNASMVKFGEPDLVIAFPGGRGTGDMMLKANAANIEVVEAICLPADGASSASTTDPDRAPGTNPKTTDKGGE